MLQILQAFRIGVINLFGISVPGFLMIMFIALGFLAPIINLDFVFSDINWSVIADFYYKNTFVLIFLVIIISYVIGYILRLSSPDDLDLISARRVLKKLDEEERKVWPYTGNKKDIFPYLNFGEYLKARDLEHLLEYVKWGDGTNETTKRSKTAINLMKIDIMFKCPVLYSVVESNEAHIRLLSGTWLAIKNTKLFVLLGAIISALTSFSLYFNLIPNYITARLSFHSIFALLLCLLFLAMFWAQRRIENLFHYRRVSELFYIVQSAYIARKETQKHECQQ